MKCSRVLLGMVFFSCFASMGCQETKGVGEKSGERVDEIIDNVKDGDPLLEKKGAGEKAGEAVDEAVDNITK